MELSARFEDAQARAKKLTGMPSNDELLELYALFKQGTVGDATGARPGMLDFRARAKFDAWASKRGMTKDAAMAAYVAFVDGLGI